MGLPPGLYPITYNNTDLGVEYCIHSKGDYIDTICVEYFELVDSELECRSVQIEVVGAYSEFKDAEDYYANGEGYLWYEDVVIEELDTDKMPIIQELNINGKESFMLMSYTANITGED